MYRPKAPLFSSSSSSSSTTFINSSLIDFSHIGIDCGNGIVAKEDITKTDMDLIVEPALICSVNNISKTTANTFCSLCGAFLLSSLEEQVKKMTQSKTNNDDKTMMSANTSDSEIVKSILTVASTSGFSKLPIWFQSPAAEEKASNEQNFPNRCQKCHDQRVLTKSLPQSFEELHHLFVASNDNSSSKSEEKEQEDPHVALFSFAISQYGNLGVNSDPALFNILRAVLMLLDEVLHDEKSNNSNEQVELITFESISSSLSNSVDDFCSSFDEGVASANTIKGGSEIWRAACQCLNRILNKVIAMTSAGNTDADDESNSTSIISLQQFFLLRCVLQNNQHRAVIVNPLKLFLKSLHNYQKTAEDSEDHDSSEDEVKKVILNALAGDASSNLQDDTVASALFLHTSRLNHSCHPNAHVEPSLTRSGAAVRISSYLRMVTEEEEDSQQQTASNTLLIKKGEEVRISYIGYGGKDTKMQGTKEEIHNYLKRNYGFDCRD